MVDGRAVPLAATGVGSVGISKAKSVSGIRVKSGLGSRNIPGDHLTSYLIDPPPDNPLNVPPVHAPLASLLGSVPGIVLAIVPSVEYA